MNSQQSYRQLFACILQPIIQSAHVESERCRFHAAPRALSFIYSWSHCLLSNAAHVIIWKHNFKTNTISYSPAWRIYGWKSIFDRVARVSCFILKQQGFYSARPTEPGKRKNHKKDTKKWMKIRKASQVMRIILGLAECMNAWETQSPSQCLWN